MHFAGRRPKRTENFARAREEDIGGSHVPRKFQGISNFELLLHRKNFMPDETFEFGKIFEKQCPKIRDRLIHRLSQIAFAKQEFHV